MNFTDSLPPFLQNEVVLFTGIALGLVLFSLGGAFLYREIRGRPSAPPPPPDGDASDSVIYRNSAGTTRTMDSSPSGILGGIARAGRSRSSGPGGTSIISGSHAPNAAPTRDQQIEPELRMAGFYRPSALAEYKSVRAMLIVLPLVFAAAIALFTEPAQMPLVVVGGLLCSALGYSIPRVYINLAAGSPTP